MSRLPSARLVPRDAADHKVVARDALGRGARRGLSLVWQLIKLAVIGVILVLVVGVALHFLNNWGTGSSAPAWQQQQLLRDREELHRLQRELRVIEELRRSEPPRPAATW